MSQREKRVVAKPTRYQATSSEEQAPKKSRTSTVLKQSIDQDIQDLKMILQEENVVKTSKDFSTTNPSNVRMFQNTSAASLPALAALTDHHDPGTSSARATVIRNEPLQHHTVQIQRSANGSLEDRTALVETGLKRMNTLLGSILRCVQPTHNGPSQKPAVIPLSSPEEVDCFENIDDDNYSNVVQYLKDVGGFSMKEAVGICLKEALVDDVTRSFTWFGRTGQRPLYNTRIMMAIYEAVSRNPHFTKPLRSDFQRSMQQALRAAKERVRSKENGPRATAASNAP